MPLSSPVTIDRHIESIYRSLAMLAGMQLDIFTPLKDGPLSCVEIAAALNVRADKLRPLLYALVSAELLTVDGDRFANTLEKRRVSSPRPPPLLWGPSRGAGTSLALGVADRRFDPRRKASDEA